MIFQWKAACAAVLLVATTMLIGCGNTYRPVASPLPTTTGNPAGPETEVVLSCCLDPSSQNAVGPNFSSVLTMVDVSGDSNMGNKVLANEAGTVVNNVPSPVTPSAAPMAFDYSRTSVFTANTATDSVTQLFLNASTGGFSANATTLTLEPGSAPIGISFQYFGSTYTQDYVVNSGTTTATCPKTGSLAAITQPSAQVKATICVGPTPVSAWIYKDQSKVFVLDSNGSVYVVSASKYQVTNTITVGTAPIKAAQSNDGNYIYVLNKGDSTISIIDGQGIDGQPEMVVGTPVLTHVTTEGPIVDALTNSPVIDIAQDTNFNDTSANSQINHVWLLHANGTVSVFDGTTPGELNWITSLSTTATVSATATPTNLALMRDGTQAYVGVMGGYQIIAIDTSKLATRAVTTSATTTITLDVMVNNVSHRSISQTINGKSVVVEATTPVVNYVAVSREGNSSDQSKAYATTTTTTTYYYYDANGNQTGSATYPNLYNGTAVVSAAAIGTTTPINTFITTILAPSIVSYCSPGNPATGEYDGQKNCPAQIPVMVLGRS